MPRIFLALLLLASALNAAANTAVEPVRKDERWEKRHDGFVAEARAGGIDVVFLGDSITDGWRKEGRVIWDAHLAPLRAANFGIDGDRTQHVLWRLEHGTLAGLSPKVVVLMIGTNNTSLERGSDRLRNTPDEALAGVTRIVATLRSQVPQARILLLAIFPRDEPGTAQRARVEEVNRGLARLHDGQHVHFLDLGPNFLGRDGALSPAIMPDKLHLTEAGYSIWAAAIRQPLADLLAAGR
ncbi:MAG: GDSL family lipase [Opitutaceae bacterium]|nr:GDSL family lipase [Opitutaceae bacterium]